MKENARPLFCNVFSCSAHRTPWSRTSTFQFWMMDSCSGDLIRSTNLFIFISIYRIDGGRMCERASVWHKVIFCARHHFRATFVSQLWNQFLSIQYGIWTCELAIDANKETRIHKIIWAKFFEIYDVEVQPTSNMLSTFLIPLGKIHNRNICLPVHWTYK